MRPFSLELHVDETTPPAFIWHTCGDRGVSVQNSLLMANALIVKGIRSELHIFPDGPHGLALGTPETSLGNPDLNLPHVAPWSDLSIAWINDQF
jgi:acetyl esterase/lipase